MANWDSSSLFFVDNGKYLIFTKTNEIKLVRLSQKPQARNVYTLPGRQIALCKVQLPVSKMNFSPNGSQIAHITMDLSGDTILNLWELENIELD